MLISFPLALVLSASASAQAPAPPEPEFSALWNGKDLSQWEGNRDLWSVEDGAITGRTTAAHPATRNTFLVWKGGPVAVGDDASGGGERDTRGVRGQR